MCHLFVLHMVSKFNFLCTQRHVIMLQALPDSNVMPVASESDVYPINLTYSTNASGQLLVACCNCILVIPVLLNASALSSTC